MQTGNENIFERKEKEKSKIHPVLCFDGLARVLQDGYRTLPREHKSVC